MFALAFLYSRFLTSPGDAHDSGNQLTRRQEVCQFNTSLL
jgi:hypothetical protein